MHVIFELVYYTGNLPKCLDRGRIGHRQLGPSNPSNITQMPVQSQSRVNPYQSCANPMPIRYRSSANQWPIRCQSIQLCANPGPTQHQSIANPSPIRCHFIKSCANLLSILGQYHVNPTSIQCQSCPMQGQYILNPF